MGDSQYFYVVCGSTGLVLGVQGGAAPGIPVARGAKLVTTTPSTGSAADGQLWTLTADRCLRHKLTGMVVDYTTTPGTPAVLWTQNSPVSPNQKWTLTPQGQVRSDLGGVVLAVGGNGPGEVVAVVAPGDAGHPVRTWQFTQEPPPAPVSPPPFFRLQYGQSGLVISAVAGGPGTVLSLAERQTGSAADGQLWTLTADRCLRHKLTGMVVDYTTTPGTPAVLWTQNSPVSPNQKWTLTPQSQVRSDLGVVLGASRDAPGETVSVVKPGTAGVPMENWHVVGVQPTVDAREAPSFFVHCDSTDLVLALAGGATAPGTPLVVAARSTGAPADRLLWTLSPDGYLLHRQTGLVAGISGADPAAGAPLVALAPDGGDTQNWTLTTDGRLRSGSGGLVIAVAGVPQPGAVVQAAAPTAPTTPSTPDAAAAAQTWRMVRDVPPVRVVTGRAVSLDGTAQDVSVPAPDFRADDLTVEAWLHTTVGGPVFASAGDLGDGSLVVAVRPDGSLFFGMVDILGGDGLMVTTTGPTAVLDGQWHHLAAVRRGTAGLLYLDGTSVPALDDLDDTVVPFEPVVFSEQSELLIGQAVRPPAIEDGTRRRFELPSYQFAGEIDEVRVWGRARTAAELAAGMHHLVADSDQDLLGCWSFDDDDAVDGTPHGRHGTLRGGPAFVDSEVEIVASGEPYLITQAKLTQDWVGDTSDPTGMREVTGYRVVVSARGSGDLPLHGYLTFWSDEPVTVYFNDGGSAVLGGRTGCTRTTNARGEVSLTIDSGGSLTCPALKVRADFMDTAERVLVYPDRQAHLALAAVTGNALLGLDAKGQPLTSVTRGRRPAPLPAGTDPAAADAVAQAIGHVMSTAVQHGVQSDRPLTRSRDLPEDLPTPRPYLPRYQHVALADRGYDPASDAIATHFLDADRPVVRVLVPENAPAPHWTYDHAGAAFRTMTAGEIATLLGTLSVQHLDDYTAAFALDPAVFSGTRKIALRSDQFTSTARSELDRRWFGGDFLDEVENAASVVVTTVQTTVTDAVSGVEQVVDTMVVTVVTGVKDEVTGLVKAFDAALQTVEDAVDFVRAILRRIGAAVDDVIRFFRYVFEWDDILVAQEVIEKYLVETRSVLGGIVHGAGDRAIGAVESIRSSLNSGVAAWRKDGHSAATGALPSAGAAAPPSLETNHLLSLFLDNIMGTWDGSTYEDEFGAELGTLVDDLTTALAQVSESLPGLLDSSPFAQVFDDPTQILTAGMDLLLQVATLVANSVLEVAEDVLRILLAMIDTLLDIVYKVATSRIDLPMLTPFYEQVVLRGNGGQCTMLSFLALAAAVPLTATFKSATGRDDPVFTAADHDAFLAMDAGDYGWISNPFAPTRATREATLPIGEDAILALSWACGFVYVVSALVWGTLETTSDLAEIGTVVRLKGLPLQKFGRPVSTALLVSQFICEVSTIPWDSDFADVLDELAYYQWLSGLLPVLSFGIGVTAEAWTTFWHPLLVGSYGLLSSGTSAGLLIYAWAAGEDDANLVIEGVREICVNLARVTQLVRLAPVKEPRLQLAAVGVEGICFLGQLASSITNTTVSMVTALP